jgi:hypothetical protein
VVLLVVQVVTILLHQQQQLLELRVKVTLVEHLALTEPLVVVAVVLAQLV